MLQMLLNDPIVWGSLLGLAVVIGLCGYYLYMFLHHPFEKDQ
ncbi:hypothetical protein [Bowmanella sp. JS7-9]|uniref:DUF3149 domain-containing protein n=1 Tax=Pseudobowmanella zhangzhouensis TaxID=1537679 RepID=A0ABW1XIL6_9ALTE|nr:hypothetical protein [Bowmanella sp. JS7-9]